MARQESKIPRPATATGTTTRVRTAHGNLYVTVTHFPGVEGPMEIFTALGKAGTCDSAYLEAIGRLASTCLRWGISAGEIASQLRSITCHPFISDGVQTYSPVDAIAKVLEGSFESHEQSVSGGEIPKGETSSRTDNPSMQSEA